MAELHVIPSRPLPVDERVVEILEDWLADAKAGRIVSVAMAGVSEVGTPVTVASGTSASGWPAMFGALAYLQHRMAIQRDAD